MKKPEVGTICPCCDQLVRKPNVSMMDSAKVELLRILGKVDGWVYIQAGNLVKDIATGNEYTGPYRGAQHAACLVSFRLAKRGPRRSGHYKISDLGRRFLRGEAVVPTKIWCQQGRVVDHEAGRVHLHDVANVKLTRAYWDNFSQHNKSRHGK